MSLLRIIKNAKSKVNHKSLISSNPSPLISSQFLPFPWFSLLLQLWTNPYTHRMFTIQKNFTNCNPKYCLEVWICSISIGFPPSESLKYANGMNLFVPMLEMSYFGCCSGGVDSCGAYSFHVLIYLRSKLASSLNSYFYSDWPTFFYCLDGPLIFLFYF